MRKKINIIFCLLGILFLSSCKEDKGNESMPINKIKGVYEPQLNYLNEALEDDPDDEELLFKRARVFLNMHRTQEALKDITEAIRLRSNKAEYYLVLAQANFLSGNYFEAIKASEKAESMGLGDPELPALQARVYWETGDTLRSALYLNRVSQIAPFHSDIHLLKGKQAAVKGDTTRAITFFLSSIRSDLNNIDAYSDLIKVYLNRGKDDSALYYTIQAQEINLKHPDFYYAQGRIFARKEMKQSALLSYKYCLREDSAYAPAMYQLGNLYYKEGNLTEALQYLRRYTVYNDDNKEVYQTIITILTGQEKENIAIPYYERLIQLDTTNMALKYKLQKLYNLYTVVGKNEQAGAVSSLPEKTTPVVRDTVQRRPAVIRRDTSVRTTPVTPAGIADSVR